MTDRELLKLAAKAAGIVVVLHKETNSIWVDGPRTWNPLHDDGDAFRLLLVLNEFEPYKSRGGFRFSPGLTPEEARRAIVRAAAEIGRGE